MAPKPMPKPQHEGAGEEETVDTIVFTLKKKTTVAPEDLEMVLATGV
jgi:hypothetical protein